MNLSDVGPWAVLWLNKNGIHYGSNSAWAFFRTKPEADAFISNVGGELWKKLSDGTLRRRG